MNAGAGMFLRSNGQGHWVNKCKNTFLVITLAAVVTSQIRVLHAKLGASLHLPECSLVALVFAAWVNMLWISLQLTSRSLKHRLCGAAGVIGACFYNAIEDVNVSDTKSLTFNKLHYSQIQLM